MNWIQKIGLGIFVIALCIFTAILSIDNYKINKDDWKIENEHHKAALMQAGVDNGLFSTEYSSSFALMSAFKQTFKDAQSNLQASFDNNEKPEGVGEWDYKLGDWLYKDYVKYEMVKGAAVGPVSDNPMRFWLLSIGLAILGGLLYIIPKFRELPGIKNNHIYHDPMKRGLNLSWRTFFLAATIIGILVYGVYYMQKDWFWTALTVGVMLLITLMVMIVQNSAKHNPARSASPMGATAWLGIFTAIYLIVFYVLLYWAPHYITGWVKIADPISEAISGNEASKWFLYGMLYTIIMLVMGIRMIAKYRHNRYQIIRTISVMFFQTAFAFLLPEILVRLNKPYYDFKNIWPLDYSFFFNYRLDEMLESGTLGIFMLVWGIALIVVAVPVITYFYGKRWYCSWVCGCGGLAETLGDPYRQLSDKSLRAWKFERFTIHSVLVFSVVMTGVVLYTYFTGQEQVLFTQTYKVREWYGFLIGSAFAGVVGTGFYPLMGNRMWCRFGCPLAAYLGLVQRFRSRFRITTNGSQCISCGNCSTHCEMGIDVRSYAQKGQDIVRSSCVGCGVCAAVCPRGVLRLENSGDDVATRTIQERTIHVSADEVRLLS